MIRIVLPYHLRTLARVDGRPDDPGVEPAEDWDTWIKNGDTLNLGMVKLLFSEVQNP